MKRLWAWVLALALLAGCAPVERDDGKTHILCTTYPVYLFTTAVTEGAEDVAVELLVNQQTACLHDYTLTVNDMKAVERADVIVLSGAGLEEFLDDALRQTQVPVIDCSQGLDLLPSLEHHHHEDEDEDEHEVDPHYWMDPRRAGASLTRIAGELVRLDPDNGGRYEANLAQALRRLDSSLFGGGGVQPLVAEATGSDLPLPQQCATTDLITFHDGFQYFAQAYGLELLKAIEEEEGAETGAKELAELVELVREREIPAIFVEKDGSRRSAGVIARETGCKVYELDMVMSGQDTGIEPYIQAMERNLATVKEALS